MTCTCKAEPVGGTIYHSTECAMYGTRKLRGTGLKSVSLLARDAGFENESNDCVVKAIQAVTGVPYRDAHAAVAERFGRRPRKGVSVDYLARNAGKTTLYGYRFFPKASSALGMVARVAVDSYGRRMLYKRPRYQTLAQFVRSHRTGRFFCCSNSHAFAVIDGVVYDNGAAGPRTQVTTVVEFITDAQCERDGRC